MDFEDKNLKAVVKKAAKVLKVPEESLKYEVISYGSTGIFGLVGAKKAKIRVVTSKAEKDNQKEKTTKVEPPKKKKEEIAVPERRGPVSKEIAEKKEPPLKIIKEGVVPENNEPDEKREPFDDSEAIEMGRAVTQKIVEKITEDATVRVETDEDGVVYHVEGGKTAILIGKRGQTLEAIQYLVDRIVNKSSERKIRLQIDVAGYLENKKSNLEQRALHLAEKVKNTGKPVTVGELNVYDRKIVHLCLKMDTDIRTQSMGSGFYRKLVIFPKKETAVKTLAE